MNSGDSRSFLRRILSGWPGNPFYLERIRSTFMVRKAIFWLLLVVMKIPEFTNSTAGFRSEIYFPEKLCLHRAFARKRSQFRGRGGGCTSRLGGTPL